jgi:MFS family permease
VDGQRDGLPSQEQAVLNARQAARTARRARWRLRISGMRVDRSRFATAAMFFFTGAVFGTWAGRIPAFKHDLGLGNGGLSLAFLSMEAAAVIGLQAGGLLVPRISSRRALSVALPVFGLALSVLGFAPNLLLLCLGLALMAGVNSIVDVAINASGVTVQYLSGRSVMSRMHAMHSVGGIAGAGIGAAAAHLDVGRAPHLLAAGVVIAIASALASRWLLPPRIERRADEDAARVAAAGEPGSDAAAAAAGAGSATPGVVTGWREGWSRPLVLIGAAAFCLTFAEGAANDWSAVYMRDELGSAASISAIAVSIFLVAMAAGRFAGDRLLARFGPVAVFRAATLTAAVSFAVALAVHHPVAGLVGLFLLGLGLSVTLPVTISAAGAMPHLSAATAVSRVSTMGYLGSFVAPAVIGVLAGPAGLSLAFGAVVLFILVTLPAARIMARATPEARAQEQLAGDTAAAPDAASSTAQR